MSEIDVEVSTKGDPSVGIWGYQHTFKLDWLGLDEPEERERVRQIFHEAFSELCDELADIAFEDECWGCRKMKDACLCEEQPNE